MESPAAQLSQAQAYLQQGQLQQAINSYQNLLAQHPESVAAWQGIGSALLAAGQPLQAVDFFERALALDPQHYPSILALGTLYQQQGRLERAVQLFLRGAQLQPNQPLVHFNLGVVLAAQGRTEQAQSAYRKALALNENIPEAWLNLGNLLSRTGELQQALVCYQQALQRRPSFTQAGFGLANTLTTLKRHTEALTILEPLCQQNPDHAEMMILYGHLLRSQNRQHQARSVFQRILAQQPNHFAARYGYATILLDLGRADLALPQMQQAARLNPSHQGLRSDLAFAQHYLSTSPKALYHEHRLFQTLIAEALSQQSMRHQPCKEPHKPLKIGFVSSDFRRHPVSFFLEAPFEHHDGESFAFYGYSNSPVRDATTQRLQGWAQAWREIFGLTDSVVAQQIVADGIDILVDLNGHTGGNRLALFALQPAPVQVSWLGYPDTTGLEAMAYRLTDTISDPESEGGRYMSETPIYLPHGFHCYRPPDEAPKVLYQQLRTGQGVRLASFNTLTKMGHEVLRLWAEILTRLPQATLLLKNGGFGSQAVVDDYLQRFESLGIDSKRIRCMGVTDTLEEHLNLYNQVDIALDTFPYHGTTTTCEALWMGVPVVTLQGDHHVNRVGGSLLHQVGLHKLVASTPKQFVDLVVGLAQDHKRLRTLRGSIRHKMQNAPLRDELGFTRNLENAFRQIWKMACATPTVSAPQPAYWMDLAPAEKKPTLRLIHHLARSGGTLICKCLGSMEQAMLLSEINPRGVHRFNPRQQAHQWYAVGDANRAESMPWDDEEAFLEAMQEIHAAAQHRNANLLVRDWTHVDFTGYPFRRPQWHLTLAETLSKRFRVRSLFTTRHPLDQWLSLVKYAQQGGAGVSVSLSLYMEGYRRFAQLCADHGFVRYEDFTVDPDARLQEMCEKLEIPFDAGYQQRWASYTNITGDTIGTRGAQQIKPLSRRPVEAGLHRQLQENSDYQQILSLLGYQDVE
ncbi:Tetratricopeptide TPR_2 repeat protein [Magnetococcus marinus MC-1]|uniref:protein O-GlcNAc transferase n=1 Tax=Magnetococcus marinus (strain ATCC BAA-1437 / JCM 17883 / MC-1) TaxID=156889 RepID=A0L852_MAGMM|nr:tetratricopeptide repeat protein [Magnetococcus marinus]ABK44145.1 Tetratricopeptide TPR_2 repeat protein [Magnetococcus marinus MC-1]